jgi:rhodanese-related sulfurtransferase
MTIKKLSPEELYQQLQGNHQLVVLDVRAEEKFNQYHIKESLHIPKTVIFNMDEGNESIPLDLPKDKEIVVTCTTGNSAAKCAGILDNHDYNVMVLEGGLTAWKAYVNSLKD